MMLLEAIDLGAIIGHQRCDTGVRHRLDLFVGVLVVACASTARAARRPIRC
jgi:hypothetical protein